TSRAGVGNSQSWGFWRLRVRFISSCDYHVLAAGPVGRKGSDAGAVGPLFEGGDTDLEEGRMGMVKPGQTTGTFGRGMRLVNWGCRSRAVILATRCRTSFSVKMPAERTKLSSSKKARSACAKNSAAL